MSPYRQYMYVCNLWLTPTYISRRFKVLYYHLIIPKCLFLSPVMLEFKSETCQF